MESCKFDPETFTLTLEELRLYRYAAFIITCIILPYIVYRNSLDYLQWEKEEKTSADHYSDIFSGISMATLLFVFGNYTNTFKFPQNLVTIITVFLSMFAFGKIGELNFAKTDLSRYEEWDYRMYSLLGGGVAFGLLLAIHHFMEASKSDVLPEFALSLFIPLLIAVAGYITVKQQNDNLYSVEWLKNKINAESETLSLPDKKKTIKLHPHHYMIFLSLAFFTRFDTWISRISAGICIGIFMQGGASYSFGSIFDKIRPRLCLQDNYCRYINEPVKCQEYLGETYCKQV